jgi:FK506-binding protein 14|eukprot:Transcript_18992.p2 GENE.Transcript_18992~~Transcript_18992.p2  ORF type:complete len:352 (+),score=72.67 Transcript_18992:77-1132(+)
MAPRTRSSGATAPADVAANPMASPADGKREAMKPACVLSSSAHVLARFVMALLCLAHAGAEEAPTCKWSWRSLGCIPKDACKTKPRLALPWCGARNATARVETARAAAGGHQLASAAAESAGAPTAATTAAAGLRRGVYEGPTECSEAQKVKVGDQIQMHYTGTIDESSQAGEPGKQFDSSRDRDSVRAVMIGVGQVIQGWDQGLIGLCQGAKAILVVPPELGYGSHGAGDVIPGGATLRFDVEVVSVSEPPAQPNLFDELDEDEDGVLTPEEIVVHFRRHDPRAELPPTLMEQEDANKDGGVSREEFGGPRMEWSECLEMLYGNEKQTALALAVQWLCQRDRDVARAVVE